MGIATGTLIAAGIAAGASVGSSAIASHAAGKAADKQKAAADASTQLQRDIYNQQRQDTMPWLQAGQGAISTLANLTGIPMGGGAPGGGGMPGQMPGQLPPSRQPSPNAQPTGQVAMPRSLAQVGQGAQGLVGLRAPDGSTRYVPQEQVDFYTQRGASRF
jgi:hypothetical protein